jgi:anti-sigma B factor antagonist
MVEHVESAQQQAQGSSAQPSSERVFTLLLEGELGLKQLAELGEELLRLEERGVRQVVLDFTEVPHLDYRGVRSLLPRVEALRRGGGDVKVSGLSPYLAAVLRASGAHGVFEVYPHCNDARAAFAASATHSI